MSSCKRQYYYACSRGSKATLTQPFLCDMPPKIQQAHRTTHTWTTTGGRTPREPLTPQTIAAAPAAQRRYLSSPAAAPLHGKRKVSCSSFLPKRKPMQHSCSHYIAFCSITCLTRMFRHSWPKNVATIMQPLHCDLQPETQQAHRTMHAWTTTRGRTPRENRLRPKRSQPHPPHRGDTFHRRLQPLYTEKQKVSCSGFLPNTTNTTLMQPLQSPLPKVTTLPSSPLP